MTDHQISPASLHPSASSHATFFNLHKPKKLVRVKDAWRFTFNTRMGLHKVSATTEEANPIKACLTCLPYLAGKLVKMAVFRPSISWVTSVRNFAMEMCLKYFYIKHHKVLVGYAMIILWYSEIIHLAGLMRVVSKINNCNIWTKFLSGYPTKGFCLPTIFAGLISNSGTTSRRRLLV